MREIKFRAWQRYHKRIAWVSNIDLKELLVTVDYGSACAPRYNTYHISVFDLMQYTGMKDKKGVEIYELDYAEKDGCIYLVMWYKNKYILKDISNGDIIELDKNINVRSNYYENAEKFTGEYSKI